MQPPHDEPRPASLDPTELSTVTAGVSIVTGERTGHYKILQQIGEGGFGVVYVADQEEPVRRRVAMKVIKLGMDTKTVFARFDAERQALALMDHPNIEARQSRGVEENARGIRRGRDGDCCVDALSDAPAGAGSIPVRLTISSL